MIRQTIVALAAAAAFATGTHAGVLYADDFDTDNGGVTALNYTGLPGVTVADGTLDLVHTGDGYGIACVGGAGGCLDLDGSTNRASTFYTDGDFAFSAGQKIVLTYAISGSQRAGYGTDGYALGLVFEQATSGSFVFATSTEGVKDHGSFIDQPALVVGNSGVPFDKPFTDVTLTFRPTTDGLLYLYGSGYSGAPGDSDDDNVGLILDDVRLTAAVPEPASWALLVAGFGLTGALVRRRRTAAAA